MSWTALAFGKHQGKTLPQILLTDPDWFFWSVENHVFDNRDELHKAEACDLNFKARQIKIPGNDANNFIVEYFVHQPTGKFSHFDIIPSGRPHHQGTSSTFRLELIDMSVPRHIASYDKLGCKQMLRSLKQALFGNESVRVTKKRAEDFFDNPSNFILTCS